MSGTVWPWTLVVGVAMLLLVAGRVPAVGQACLESLFESLIESSEGGIHGCLH